MNGDKPDTIKELFIWMQGEFKEINGKIDNLKYQRDSTQRELSEHKKNHWVALGIIISVVAMVTTAISNFVMKLLR